MPEEATLDRQEALLEAFIESRGDLDQARTAARVVKKTFYEWLQHDEIFRERFDHLRVMLAEELESEAVKRTLGRDGQRGSDAMLTTLLKGLKRERYGEPDGNRGVQQVFYVSNLRELPRPGVEPRGRQIPQEEQNALQGPRDTEEDVSRVLPSVVSPEPGEATWKEVTPVLGRPAEKSRAAKRVPPDTARVP